MDFVFQSREADLAMVEFHPYGGADQPSVYKDNQGGRSRRMRKVNHIAVGHVSDFFFLAWL